MLSETVNKAKSQPPKKVTDKSTKNMKKDNTATKKEANGLRVPGSNWQAFKSLVTENNSKQSNFSSTQIKKKKLELTGITDAINHSSYKNTDEVGINGEIYKRKGLYRNDRPTRKNSQVINYLLNFFLLFINFVIIIFYGNKQQTTKTAAQITKKVSETRAKSESGLTKVIAMDCEMVGIGNDGQDSMIARVSIVNKHGVCLYDKYVKPTEEVTDYRTTVSGIRPQNLKNGTDFKVVQKEVSEILWGRTLVGHALHNDLAVLFLSHPRRLQRDTSRYKPFRKVSNGNTPSLKKLASELLGVDIQSGEHSSVEDARATMQLYQLFRRKWELEFKHKR